MWVRERKREEREKERERESRRDEAAACDDTVVVDPVTWCLGSSIRRYGNC